MGSTSAKITKLGRLGMNKYLWLLCAVLLFAGCLNHRDFTRQEWKEISSKTYEGLDQGKLIDAIDRLFILSDGDDYSFLHTDGYTKATHRFLGFYQYNANIWHINYNEENSTTNVSLQLERNKGGITKTHQAETSVYLFFKRLDYLLGLNNKWLACSDIKNEQAKLGLDDNEDFLCNAFTKDNLPGQLREAKAN